MTEIELEMENDTELRIECEQIYIMDDYEQLKNKPRLNGKEISGDMYETDPTIPEWAVYKTHTTRYTLVVINICSAIFITMNCVHTTCLCARALHLNNRTIWACITTASTINTFFRVNL